MVLKLRKERGWLKRTRTTTTTTTTTTGDGGGKFKLPLRALSTAFRSKRSTCCYFLGLMAVFVSWNVYLPMDTFVTTPGLENLSQKPSSPSTTKKVEFIDKDEFGRSTTAHDPYNPLLPRLLRIEEIATGTFFEDTIFRYEGIQSSTSTFRSSVCKTSSSSIPILTNYSASAISDLSAYVLVDNEPVLKRSNSTEKPYATCQFRNYQFSAHFPHFMQQLFRCWSFWMHHSPDKTPIFVPTARRSPHMRRAKIRPFTLGLLKLLPKIGVKMIEPTEVEGERQQSMSATSFHDSESISCAILGPLHNPNAISFEVESVNHMHILRDRVQRVLSINGTGSTPGGCVSEESSLKKNRLPRIAILNRKGSRSLANPQEVARAVETSLGLEYKIPEIYFEGRTFEEQTNVISAIDIIITPHGAQETSMVMMPDCGGVFEIIPGDYYYPNFFGTLAATSGLEHGFVYLGKDVAYHFYNVSVRNPELCPRVDDVVAGVRGLVDRWQSCCSLKLGL